jgi:hypothetical protein
MAVPQYVAMTEAMGRRSLRNAVKGAQAMTQANQPSIKDKLMMAEAAEQMPQMPQQQMPQMPQMAQQQMPQMAADGGLMYEEGGLASLPAYNMDTVDMAGGGIIAFEGGGEVPRFSNGSIVVDPRGVARMPQYPLALYEDPTKKIPKSSILKNLLRRSGYGMAALTGADLVQGLVDSDTGTASEFLDPIAAMQGTQGGYDRGEKALKPLNIYQQAQKDENERNFPPAAVDPANAAPGSSAPAAAPGSSVPPASPASSAGAGGKYEKDIQEMMADLKKGLGGGRAQKDLDALREEMKGSREQNLYMALIQGGAKAMQSKANTGLAGLAEGLEEGARTYGKGLEGERADKKLLLAQQSALEQAEYARKSGNLNALIAAQTRLDNVSAQRENLAAQKELAILSSRDKAYGDLVGRLYVQTQDIDQAKAMADKIYSSSNLGGMPGGSTAAPSAAPKKGDVRGGYKFNGGNPNDKNNWSKV